MSPAELSDRQLDALLGKVDPPPPPSAELVDRIVARATADQPARAAFPVPPRHRPRRHRITWGAVIAANMLAAAAAASSWDGERFDFHRLTDLPHRVALAIHLPQRDKHHELASREAPRVHPRPAGHAEAASVAPRSRSSVPNPTTHQLSIPVRPPVYPPRALQLPVRAISLTAGRQPPRAVQHGHLTGMRVRELSPARHPFELKRAAPHPLVAGREPLVQERSSEIAPPLPQEERQAETLARPAPPSAPTQNLDMPRENQWRERAQGFGPRMRDRPFDSSAQRQNWMRRMPRGHRGFHKFGRRF